MVSYGFLVAMLCVHMFADFICQTHDMAINKSKSNDFLFSHILMYTIIISVAFGPLYGLVNGILHFGTDYFTSRRTSVLFGKGDYHNGFVVVGFDQLIHALCLIFTYPLADYWYL